MDLQLENKVVLVTGGAKGIGAAIVRAAAADAAIPVIVDRDADAGKHLHSEIRIKPHDHRGSVIPGRLPNCDRFDS